MLAFDSDYIEGAHGEILKRLVETNLEQNPGYGTDAHCARAKELIRADCGCPEAEIFFLVGGTQTNQVVISSLLKPYEGVVSAATGHVNVHEAGAIEATGHKVMELPGHMGKLDAGELRDFLARFWADGTHEHMVFPGMVYISHPTELGTLYTKKELEQISGVCGEYGIPLYLDGARLACGIMSSRTDVSLPDIARLCDVFYIGGTKMGALFGEAVVFTKHNMPQHFMTLAKRRGALLAKGWLLGIQFETLFTDGLYWKLGRHADEMAELLQKGFREKGSPIWLDSPTNQQFVILPNALAERLKETVRFSVWEPADESRTVVRFAASWATKKENIEKLMELL